MPSLVWEPRQQNGKRSYGVTGAGMYSSVLGSPASPTGPSLLTCPSNKPNYTLCTLCNFFFCTAGLRLTQLLFSMTVGYLCNMGANSRGKKPEYIKTNFNVIILSASNSSSMSTGKHDPAISSDSARPCWSLHHAPSELQLLRKQNKNTHSLFVPVAKFVF